MADEETQEMHETEEAHEPDAMANPAEPLAPTVVNAKPMEERNRSLVGKAMSGYPKWKYHEIHGGVMVNDPSEEAGLMGPPTDWADTPEEIDMRRTATAAWETHHANIQAKLNKHADAGREVVRNSVTADESVRRGNAEPL